MGQLFLRRVHKFALSRDFDGSLVFQADYVRIFIRSVTLAAAATAVCLLLAIPLAFYIVGCAPRRKAILLLLVTVPFWTCVVVQMYGWIILLADNGLLNQLLDRLHITHGTLGALYTDGATLLGLVYAFLPFMVLSVYAALDDLDWRIVEAALDLGASGPAAFREVVLPSCREGIAAGVGLVFLPALGMCVVPTLLGGNHAMMFGNLVAFQFAGGRNWPLGAAMSLVLLGVLLAVMLVRRVRLAWRPARGSDYGFA